MIRMGNKKYFELVGDSNNIEVSSYRGYNMTEKCACMYAGEINFDSSQHEVRVIGSWLY